MKKYTKMQLLMLYVWEFLSFVINCGSEAENVW